MVAGLAAADPLAAHLVIVRHLHDGRLRARAVVKLFADSPASSSAVQIRFWNPHDPVAVVVMSAAFSLGPVNLQIDNRIFLVCGLCELFIFMELSNNKELFAKFSGAIRFHYQPRLSIVSCQLKACAEKHEDEWSCVQHSMSL